MEDQVSHFIFNQPKFIGGQLKNFGDKWKDLTSDSNILDIVYHCHIEFASLPTQFPFRANPEHSFASQEQVFVDEEISKLLNSGVIVQSTFSESDVVSPIFVRPKPDGSHRLIFNLKLLNKNVSYHHFKMDTLETAVKLMTPGCFMTSIDLKDAYYSIPVAIEQQKYLKFLWKGTLYQFTCLPMGLTSSPRIFTKLLKPVFSYIRTKFGFSCSGYIDDSIYLDQSYQVCLLNTFKAVQLLASLGFIVHPKKSVVIPTQIIEFLGFVLNSVNMTVTLTTKKIAKITHLCQTFLVQNKMFTIREIASLIGSLTSTFPGVQYGPLHFRSIEKDKTSALVCSRGNFDAKMILSSKSLEDLYWWVNNLSSSYKRINNGEPSATIFADASMLGWGAKFNDATTNGSWSLLEKSFHINYLELSAVKLALLSLCRDIYNAHIRIMSDSTTAVCYINAMGGCKSVRCNELTKEIWNWAISRNIWLSAAHIPGAKNSDADFQSRHLNSNLEWSISNLTFNKIVCFFGKPTIDLFASRLNRQVETFVSWKPDPLASFVDAFSLNWSKYDFYAFPPFSLVGRCLQKINLDKASGIMVVPLWPTQAYFALLLSMLIETPRYIRATMANLGHHSMSCPHPLSPKLVLLVCKLSGNPCESASFRQKSSTQSCHPGETGPKNSIPCTSTDGYSFVCKGTVIQCLPL